MADLVPTQDEVISRLVAMGAKPTGSRHVGGWTEDSDIDYFVPTSLGLHLYLATVSVLPDWSTDYTDAYVFSYRSDRYKQLNVIVMSPEYFRRYDFANDQVKAMEGSPLLATREGRIDQFKHFLAMAEADQGLTVS